MAVLHALFKVLLSWLRSTEADLRLVVDEELFWECLSLSILLERFSYLKEGRSNLGLDIFLKSFFYNEGNFLNLESETDKKYVSNKLKREN